MTYLAAGYVLFDSTSDTLDDAYKYAGYSSWQEAADSMGIRNRYESNGDWKGPGTKSIVGMYLKPKGTELDRVYKYKYIYDTMVESDRIIGLVDGHPGRKKVLTGVETVSSGVATYATKYLSKNGFSNFGGIAISLLSPGAGGLHGPNHDKKTQLTRELAEKWRRCISWVSTVHVEDPEEFDRMAKEYLNEISAIQSEIRSLKDE